MRPLGPHLLLVGILTSSWRRAGVGGRPLSPDVRGLGPPCTAAHRISSFLSFAFELLPHSSWCPFALLALEAVRLDPSDLRVEWE